MDINAALEHEIEHTRKLIFMCAQHDAISAAMFARLERLNTELGAIDVEAAAVEARRQQKIAAMTAQENRMVERYDEVFAGREQIGT